MSNVLNPNRFADALRPEHYRRGLSLIPRHRNQRASWLSRRKGDDQQHEAARALGAVVEGCTCDCRCHSLACPACADALKRLFTGAASDFLRREQEEIYRISVIPSDSSIPPGHLNAANHARSVRRNKERLGKAGLQYFLGASDWSFNQHLEGRYRDHWCHHIYGFAPAGNCKQLRKLLLDQFSPTDACPRPVAIKKWDGNRDALRYALKDKFCRRIGTDNGSRFEKGGGTRICRATDKQPLRKVEKLELLMFLDEIGIQGRLFLMGLQFSNLSGTGPGFVLRPRSRDR